MNKTVITSVTIVSLSILLTCCYFIHSNEKISLAKEKAVISRSEIRDRFTVCIDTVMHKSIESNKPISAGEAKDICSQVKKV